ncbi:cupin domain-containing protein [Nocardia yamanashiensis]|uniref:cupin domain-containing protein n=1 Tax=Nocardia yamanashiensis TaxID=209247 RepID=UPI000830A75A|nr:cupin domain-containing protein [Nocardia yamanashiensis]
MQHTLIPPFTVLRPGEGRHVPIPGFGADLKFDTHLTHGAVSIVEHPFAVGQITPPHTHTFEDEYSLVLEGEIGFRSGDAETVLGPGGYVIKPRGEMHAMWNAGDTPGRIVEIIIPGGFEQYFAELGELTATGTTPATAFDDLAARYGLTYGHPDWLDDVIARYHLNPPTHGTTVAHG